MKKNFHDRFAELNEEVDLIIKDKFNKQSALTSSIETYVDTAKLNAWTQRVKNILKEFYGQDSDYYKDFLKVSKGVGFSTNYGTLINYQKPIFDSAMSDIPYQSKENKTDSKEYALNRIYKICNRFYYIARQLQSRHDDRDTLDIEDEYDVQDLLHALLKVDFDDIRPEEYSPSYASSSSRVDFLLKKEKIVIEVKKTRKSLKTKEIGEQLIIDIARYKEHPDCDMLICFVYDPEGKISNPTGLICDLEKNNPNVKVIINPL